MSCENIEISHGYWHGVNLDKLQGYLTARMPTPSDAEEVFVNTLESLWRAEPEIISGRVKSIHPYVYTIARCRVSDFYRKNARVDDVYIEEMGEVGEPAGPHLEDVYVEIEQQSNLMNSMALLNPDDRQLLEDMYLLDLSMAQIAQNLRTTEKIVKARLYKARQRLKERIEERD